MRRNTPKRAAQERQYRAARILYLETHRSCEIGTGLCTREATQIHHKRGRIGKLLLAVEWWAAVCATCHEYATSHPEEAYERGWSIRRAS